MKRGILFAWVLVVSMGTGGIAAQERTGAIEAGTVAARPGETVLVPIYTSFDEALRAVFVVFIYDAGRLRYLGYSVEGSEAAGVDPFAILHLDFGGGQAVGGFSPERRQSMDFRVPAGNRRHVGSLRFLVLATAPEGAAEVRLAENIPATAGGTEVVVEPAGVPGGYESRDPESIVPGAVTVLPPIGPRPVGDLACEQFLDRVRLSFSPTEAYDELRVLRAGAPVATLPGSATGWEETMPAVGALRYEVVAVLAGVPSLAAGCEVLTVTPAAPPVKGLLCEAAGVLRWENASSYDRIHIHRNGERIADLPGDASAYSDPEPSLDLAVYTVISELEGFLGPETTCISNGVWILEAGDVMIRPGEARVTVPLYLTNAGPIAGWEAYLGIDTSTFGLVRDFDLALEGSEGFPSPEYYHMGISGAYPGAPAVGMIWDFHAPIEPEKDLPPGLRQHIFGFVFDVVGEVSEGDVFPVTFRGGSFMLRGAITQNVSYLSGSIHVGTGGVLPVVGLEAAVEPAEGGGAAGGDVASDVRLAWRNGGAYQTVRLERNGELLAEISGDATEYRDAAVPGGVFLYKVSGVSGGRSGFPESALVSTYSPPGAFLRSDSNRDGRLDVSDPIATLRFLFLGGEALQCEDAADTDDSGDLSVTDAILSLRYLFWGEGVIRAPGTRYPWFDPTTDGLTCRG